MVGILIDSNYRESLWCKSLYESLTERLRQKRIPFCEVFDCIATDLETIFIIASNIEWTCSVIKQLNQNNIKPILICNQAENLPNCIYSCVCSDINASMKNLLDALKAKDKYRIALYGINSDSISDLSRVDSLFNWRGQHFEEMQVFNNKGSLKNCFDEFFSHINNFDAAICANDFAAVSLVRYLKISNPEKLKDFYIISCAANKISNYYREHILSLNMNFEQYGKAAVYIFEALKKHNYISDMTIKVLWSVESCATPHQKSTVNFDFPKSNDSFYNDSELNEMMIVDKLLTLSDETEKKILNGLIDNKTLEEIAEECFLTTSSVKYHIKKLIHDSGAIDKQQITKLLKKYIDRL